MKTQHLLELNGALVITSKKEGLGRKVAYNIAKNLVTLGPTVERLRKKFLEDVEAAKGGREVTKEEDIAIQQDLWAKGLDAEVAVEGLRKLEAGGVPWEKLDPEATQILLRSDLVEGEIA